MTETTEKDAIETAKTTEKPEEIREKPQETVEEPLKNEAEKKKGFFSFIKVLLCLAVVIGAVVGAVPSLRQKAIAVYNDKIAPRFEKKVADDLSDVAGVPVNLDDVTVVEEIDIVPQQDDVGKAQESAGQPEDARDLDHEDEIVAEDGLPADDTAAQIKALNDKIDFLTARIQELNKAAAHFENEKADKEFVAALANRVRNAERKITRPSAEKERKAALLMALTQLQRAVNEGKSFLTQEQALETLVSPKSLLGKKIMPLKAYAETGVATPASLQEAFPEYARRLVRQAGTDENDCWLKKALTSLKGLVVVRRLDAPVDDMSTTAVLARAEIAVENGEFQTAVRELKNLNNKDIGFVVPWISDAERMIAVRNALDEMTSVVLSEHPAR